MSTRNILRAPRASVISLTDRISEILDITELKPTTSVFAGKSISTRGVISEYPGVTWWRQRVAHVAATPPALCAYFREARTRNICLIRGAPANIERQPTRRQRAFDIKRGRDRGDHGFVDTPTKLLPFDIDGAQMKWRDNPEGAIKRLVAQMGEPWDATSFVWFFSTKHGLERDGKRWTGNISDGKVYARVLFITERALNEAEAKALRSIVQARVPFKLDPKILNVVQPNYIRRPQWAGHPDEDVLGDIPTIGYVKGAKDYLAVADDLTHQARWAKSQGRNAEIADHPDAEAAVRGIGTDGSVRPHVMAAVRHLLIANPVEDVVSFADHSIVIVERLQSLIAQHREEIADNLVRNGRSKHVVDELLQHTNTNWALWLLDHQGALNRKTIKLTKEERVEPDAADQKAAILARVASVIDRAREGRAQAVLLVAPTGSRKSTQMRANAVRYVTDNPDESVVILMPRHKLGDEQIKQLRKDHSDVAAAVWRGRHADDPEEPDPQHPDKFRKMCWRDDEARELETAMISVEGHLCKQGRGAEAIKCPLYPRCGYQRQKRVKANIWFCAHEMMVHAMPKAFGNVGWIMIDESPLDAFMFGISIDDQLTLALDTLRLPPPGDHNMSDAAQLQMGMEALYQVLHELTPVDPHKGVPVTRKSLGGFVNTWHTNRSFTLAKHDPSRLQQLTWKGKVLPDIRPNMSESQMRAELEKASGNGLIRNLATLWKLIEEAARSDDNGRIQVHRGKEGRFVRMVGLKSIAKNWKVKTLICDATGDFQLLQAIWPQLEEDRPQDWQQMPRPKSVRVFQCVDRSISKWAVAVESKLKEGPNRKKDLERKGESARRMYAALLMSALQYGGAEVAAITYKSTKIWILKNCFVPEWLKLYHHGDVTGTNEIEHVRALYTIGRPMPSPEDVTRQTEALFGRYIEQREYCVRRKHGRIPTVKLDVAGNNRIDVDVREHPNPMAERMRRQVTEGALIQCAGRARAGLRGDDEPLDIHLWTDVPVPELGPVEPVPWDEIDAGLDGIMLASEGIWLESIPHAAQAFADLFSLDGLKTARKNRGKGVSLIYTLVSKTPLLRISYQREGKGQKLSQALSLKDSTETRAWLEEKLGPLLAQRNPPSARIPR